LRGRAAAVRGRVAAHRQLYRRESDLDRLDAILMGGKPAAVTQASGTAGVETGHAAVHGMGGVGKS
jgi:hypothetical protein